MPSPRVSIITATYNRSNVLALAVKSVLASTREDWELIVVGDHCTDDTAEVISRVGDDRVRFVNLPENCGEQSGPNNAGIELARGSLIAYLNHDDLWYPDHLEVLVNELEREPADLVFSMLEVIEANGTRTLSGATPTGHYEPWIYVPASSWLLTRRLVEDMGGWRPARQSFNVPSQDFLYRAWKAKRVLRQVPRLTGVAIPSGSRRNVYARRDSEENERWFEEMSEPGFREMELMRLAHSAVAIQTDLRVTPKLRRALENVFRRACIALGFHPGAIRNMVLYGHRGGLIRHRRRNRGVSIPETELIAMNDEKWPSIDGATKDPQSITADWTLTRQTLIDGVVVREVRNVPKENGCLTEIYRADWNLDPLGVAQVFQVSLNPGGVSAWHTHATTTDRLFVNSGRIRIALYDARPGSSTHGILNEFRFGEQRPALIVVPPGIYHGVVNISTSMSSVLNLVDTAYRYEDPDHWRLPADSESIPYCIGHGGGCKGRHGATT